YPEMQMSEVDEAEFVRMIEIEHAGQPAPAHLRGLRELRAERVPNVPSTSIARHPIQLTADGRMIGRLVGIQKITGRPKMIRNANVFIIQDDRVVARSSVNELGVFEVRGLEPGLYSIVAAGQDGFGALGFEL